MIWQVRGQTPLPCWWSSGGHWRLSASLSLSGSKKKKKLKSYESFAITHHTSCFNFISKKQQRQNWCTTGIKQADRLCHSTFRSLMRCSVAVVAALDSSFSLISFSSSLWISLQVFNTWCLLDRTLSVQPMAVPLSCSSDRDASFQTQKSISTSAL